MAICRILQFGEPILQQACAAVSSVDESVRNLIQNLKDTLDSTTGVGLAAPQIGVNQRVFIYDAGRADGPGNYKVLINPEITAREGETVSKREGCKSAPELRVDVERSKEIDVEGLDESGNRVHRHADGFESIVIQHETDHVNGKLITEQLSGDSRDSYGRRLANINRMQTDTRYTHNLEEIHKRLAPFASSAEGVLFSQNTAEYQILVIKAGTQIQLYFAEPASDAKEAGLSGIMSRVDLEEPLDLLGIYTQAMMLSLLWTPEPKSVYVLGFGGGRNPMVLHHYYPELVVESTEIDRTVVSLARKYFGIATNDRMKVFIEDGREYLARQTPATRYDIILVDCYTGAGHHPYSLSTTEFYALCKDHLTAGGVVATNLVSSDPLFEKKVNTFTNSFDHVWRFSHDGADVFFGSSADLRREQMISEGEKLYERFSFVFPFRELIPSLRPVILKDTSRSVPPLSDKTASEYLKPDDPIFYGAKRNDPCPCGSGKKFKKCHGR